MLSHRFAYIVFNWTFFENDRLMEFAIALERPLIFHGTFFSGYED